MSENEKNMEEIMKRILEIDREKRVRSVCHPMIEKDCARLLVSMRRGESERHSA